jgi:hypothetical protein
MVTPFKEHGENGSKLSSTMIAKDYVISTGFSLKCGAGVAKSE